MYSKQNIINRKKAQNNYLEEIKKASNSGNSNQKIYQKNYLTYRVEDNNNSFNNDYLKEYYQNKKTIKNNTNKYYIKKTLKIANDRTHNHHMTNYKKNYMESISQERIKKKTNLIYTLNPHNSNLNSPSKINEFDYSVNLSKGNLLDNLNNYNYNISGYNTINNVGVEIKLDNNTFNSINSNNNLQKSVSLGINKYGYISNPGQSNYHKFNNAINSKRDKLRKNYLHKSNPDLNKFLTLLNDNTNIYSKDNFYLETYHDKNLLTLNPKTNNLANYENQYSSLNTDFYMNKRRKKRLKSNKKSIVRIKKEVEFRKNEFEKMRTIEKKIKKYFVENGVSYKNRELYHQSAIIIQSNFRAFSTKKNVRLFIKFKGIINALNNIFSKLKKIFFENFVTKLKTCKKYYESDDAYITNKNYIKKKKVKFIVENLNNFSIINNKENNIKLNEKLEKENQILKNKLNELETEIKRLKNENGISKIKECQINKNIIANKEININKIKENIENVSKELEQINNKNKKNDILCLSPNLKNYININNKNLIKPNTICKIIDNNNKNINDFKQLFLKYLINARMIKTKEAKRYNFYKLKTNIKIDELNEIIQINIIKQMINIIQTKLKQNVYLFFLKMHFKYSCSKNKKLLLYGKNTKFRNSMRTLKSTDEI